MKQSAWFVVLVVAVCYVALSGAVGPDDIIPDPNLPRPPSTADCGPWSYNRTDNAWAEICPAYLLCAPEYGRSQSPIDIVPAGASNYSFIGPLSFTDLGAEVIFENTGHVLEVAPEPGAADPLTRLEITGGPLFSDLYNLTQFHVHTPSEHTLNGVQYPLEFHFVHRHTSNNALAVIGQLFEVGARNQWIDLFLNGSVPMMAGEERPTVANMIRPYENLLTGNGTFAYWYYSGSLTTPPCSQNVNWFVSQIVSTASIDQIEALESGVFARRDSRNVQPLNGRTVFAVSGQAIEFVPSPTATPTPSTCPGTPTPTPTCGVATPSPSPSCGCSGNNSNDDDDGTHINFYFADMLRH